MRSTAKVSDMMVKLIPGGERDLAHLSDGELLANTRRLVGTSNRLFAALLLHLAEVEARGIHRQRSCASLYTYCIYELRMSEDAAARRSSAARWVKAFPPLLDAVAAGELHLTGLLMLGPHLTPENHVEVLARAKFRTKKELARLVRELHPLAGVPDQVEALGPEPLRASGEPAWKEWATALSGPVRELPSEERPGAWADDGVWSRGEEPASTADDDDATAPAAPARCELPPITAPQQYRMQFSTTEEHVRLVERAKALLARTAPGRSLGELHEEAMQLLVARLEKAKFAVTAQPQPAQPAPAQSGKTHGRAELGDVPDAASQEHELEPEQNSAPRRRGRHAAAAVKREVFVRDAGRCSYVDERGERCRETRYLELHHLKPFARGGAHAATNLALRCTAHNALAAEEDFGRAVIEHKRRPHRHDALAAQARRNGPAEPPHKDAPRRDTHTRREGASRDFVIGSARRGDGRAVR